jgi:hypothetical protein
MKFIEGAQIDQLLKDLQYQSLTKQNKSKKKSEEFIAIDV